MQNADFTKPLGTEKRNFFSVMFPYMHSNIWLQARDTENMAPRTKPSRGGAEESQFVQKDGFGSLR